jgi:hypothetical protein
MSLRYLLLGQDAPCLFSGVEGSSGWFNSGCIQYMSADVLIVQNIPSREDIVMFICCGPCVQNELSVSTEDTGVRSYPGIPPDFY